MLNWKLFVLGSGKIPLPNCNACAVAPSSHDREACECLTCHGFYAATRDMDKLTQMLRAHPDGHVAARMGAASGVIALDVEGESKLTTSDGVSGMDVLDDWENWVGGWPLPNTQLAASTPSGGLHLFYGYKPGIRSRNRVLPGIDLKSDGGYVVLAWDGTKDRKWIRYGDPAEPEDTFLHWLRTARGRLGSSGRGTPGHSAAYDFELFKRDGCPGGSRDEFFNELIFRMRKAGLDLGRVIVETREHWHRCAQPPDARWYMPWHHVEGKIHYIFRTVEPADVSAELRRWADAQLTTVTAVGRHGEVVSRPLRVTKR